MNLPSREECEGWDQAQVAFFFSRNKMQECVNVTNRLRINGQRLLNLSDSDMNQFTLISRPQLQKIVQDIKKNDGSLLNKLRRLTSKPLPKVPARDYRDDRKDDELSDPDYDNDTYEDPCGDQDDSYEPPPSHRAFTTTPCAALSRGEYLDDRRQRPCRPPRKPLRPGKDSKQLPPEPAQQGSDEEDYIDPDCINDDDDNYVEPAENPSSNPVIHGGGRAGRELPMLHKPLPEHPPRPGRYSNHAVPQHHRTIGPDHWKKRKENQRPLCLCSVSNSVFVCFSDFYEVPDKEGNSLSLPASRPRPNPTTHSHSLPPMPSPRGNTRRSPTALRKTSDDDEYEVCDPRDRSSDNPADGPCPPKPLPRDRSPKPPRPEFKPKEFESRTRPAMWIDQKPLPPKAFTLDLKRPIVCVPLVVPGPADRGTVSAENVSTDQDKDADIDKKPWYAGACDRKTADDALCRSNMGGAFMVRKSSGQDAQQPYTLVVFYNDRVYNIPIRFIAATQQYALGREKKGEEHFSSVCHIIENHQRTPLVLIDSQSNAKDATKLRFPARP
ncbi:B-cell linker protein [Clinocottus analis]|uniref:B-cell linker protein n=1 Tax=Clinocottus analis TaxID=304258 RepID=UPI0035C1859A